jgi:hypothetical protein
LVVGKEVIALHPICGHLHTGTISATYVENLYFVRFSRPELGMHKVIDVNISTKSLNSTNKFAIDNIDYDTMSIVIKLLEYKGNLIEKFK